VYIFTKVDESISLEKEEEEEIANKPKLLENKIYIF
jgi:hypothetical protein